jgi:hypothetical protein
MGCTRCSKSITSRQRSACLEANVSCRSFYKALNLDVGEDGMNNRIEYYKISSFIFLYFFTWSASIGLLAIWLGQKANLSGSVIGTVFAVNGIFSVILKPIYGATSAVHYRWHRVAKQRRGLQQRLRSAE